MKLPGGICGSKSSADETTRPTFAALRGLLEPLRQRCERHPLTQLSMGMTNDFEVAIEEGATLIRLGTVLFEGLG